MPADQHPDDPNPPGPDGGGRHQDEPDQDQPDPRRSNSSQRDPYAEGAAMIREVYAGHVVDLPEGTMAFNDVMMRSLFAEVWDRDVLSIDARRLLVMGVIAARGQVDTWRIQARAALERGELTPDELRETLVLLAPYAGYPVVAPLIAPTEEVIAEFERSR